MDSQKKRLLLILSDLTAILLTTFKNLSFMFESYEISVKKNKKKGIYILPNLLTLCSLFAGFYAVISSFSHNFDIAAFAIFVAMLFDSLDGRIARLTNTQTAFGAELDSLSDVIAFGLAPAIVSYNWCLFAYGKFGWAISFLYLAAVALRLARFNTIVQSGEIDKRYFKGLACTPAAGVIAGFIWIFAKNGPSTCLSVILALMVVVLSVLMVSRINYRSFKDLNLHGKVSFVTIVLILTGILIIALKPDFILFVIFALYAFVSPVIWLYKKLFSKKNI